MFYINRVLLFRLILVEYVTGIEYIQDNNIIVSNTISHLPNNENYKTVNIANYTMKTASGLNDNNKISEDMFFVHFKMIDQYQDK